MQFEVDIIVGLQSVASDGLTTFFQLVSLLGSYLGFVLLLICFLVLNRRLALTFSISFLGGVGFNYILKTLIARPRPYVAHPEILNLTQTVGHAMPSSHALCCVIIGVFICYAVFKYSKNWAWRTLAIVGSSVLIVLTCLSRLYLGMHYLTDILVGIAIASIICSIAILYLERKKHVHIEKSN